VVRVVFLAVVWVSAWMESPQGACLRSGSVVGV